MTNTRTATDPRIGALLDLTQGLIAKYTELAGQFAERLDETERKQLIEHVQDVAESARDRWSGIAAMPGPTDT